MNEPLVLRNVSLWDGRDGRVQPAWSVVIKDGRITDILALGSRRKHLLTGDRKHFGPYFSKSIQGVHIMMVRGYLVARGLT